MLDNLLTDTAHTLYKTALTTHCEARREVAALQAEGNTAGTGAAVRLQHLDRHMEVVDVNQSIEEMIEAILPRRVLARVKRFLRRECRKPHDMKVKIYLQHLLRINHGELDNLPPFQPNQNLSMDELLDIVLFGTPKSWQKEMDRQGFDPMIKTLNEVTHFMEQIEAAEEFEPKPNNNDKSKNKSSNKGKGYSKTPNGNSKPFCMYHGQCGHTSEECTVLQEMSKQKKAKFERGSSSNNYNNSSKKDWKKKAHDGNYKSKKDLAAFVKKAVKSGVQKELQDKKRKAAEETELDLNALEQELKDFNYTEMEKLQLSDNEDNISC